MTTALGSWLGSYMGEELHLDESLAVRVIVGGRPLVVNAERQKHWATRAREVAEIREAAAWQWLQVKRTAPPVIRMMTTTPFFPIRQFVVVSRPTYPNNADHPDTGSCFPSVKSIVDGARDAGVIEDDKPINVLANIELPAVVSAAPIPSMSVTIIPVVARD